MTKITLTHLANLQNEATAVSIMNNNSDTVQAAWDNTLSRDGTAPNMMGADFDMNSHKILNLPTPVNPTDVVRLEDLENAVEAVSLGLIPLGGANGAILHKKSSLNFDWEWTNTPTLLTYNGLNITTTNGTLTVANTKTLTVDNSLELAGVDGSVITFQGTDTYVGRDTTDTLTNKSISGSTNTLTNIANGSLVNSSITVAGHVISLGGSSAIAASDLSNGVTGSGAVVLANTPTLITPVLGAATATTINKVTITPPATAATLTIANNKTLTVNNSITFAGTDTTTMTFPSTSATIARTDTGQTFTGTNAFGVITATTVNGNTFTTGTYTLTGAASKTLTFNNSLTLAGTDSTTITFQGTDTYVGRTTTDTLTNKTLTAATLTAPVMSTSVFLTGINTPTALAANTNDYNPTNLSTTNVLRISASGGINLTGLTAQSSGFTISLVNVGSNTITLTNEDALSTAANRFHIGANTALGAGQSILIWYDTTLARWVPLAGAGSGGGGGGGVTSIAGNTGAFTLGTGLTNSVNVIQMVTPVATANLGSGTANSTSFLRGDNTWAVIALNGLVSYQLLTSTQTVTIPAGATRAYIRLVGGGGGGGGAKAAGSCPTVNGNGGPGAAGAALRKFLTGLTPGNTLALTIGAAGTAGAATPTAGGSGGSSSLASGTQTITTLTAPGGGGGGSGNGGNGGTGSDATLATNGDINLASRQKDLLNTGLTTVPGQDAPDGWGCGAPVKGINGNSAGVSGNGFGASATGGQSTNTGVGQAGGAGLAGACEIMWFS